jgi:serine/threonine-protein kinase
MTTSIPSIDTKRTDNKYQLLAKIGSGGMGDVFLGIQRGAVDFSRLVVIKRIHAHLFQQEEQFKEEHAKMFINEASLVASLNHPHIVKIYDFCITGRSVSIVMEYVEGETLRYIHAKCAKAQKPIPLPIVYRLILNACDALNYAHKSTSHTGESREIIHRDIGLHNLMLDSNGYLKVIDFGIAKSNVQSELTSPGLVKGNPGYLAPDQFIEKKLDHRVDIYALGLCLYELITLKRAFQFEPDIPLMEIINEVMNRELPPPSEIVPNLPDGMDELVMKATQKNREERFQTIEDFSKCLRAVIGSAQASQAELKEWFEQSFEARLKKRRDFSGRMIELAKQKTTGFKSAASVLAVAPPSDLISLNSITPTPASNSLPQSLFPRPTTPFSSPLSTSPAPPNTISAEFMKPGNLYRILGMVFLFFLCCSSVVYLFFFRESASEEIPVTGDNLSVHCEPSGATLSVDGKNIGLVGSNGLSLHVKPNREHEIVLSKKGFRDYTLPFIGPSKGTKQIDATLMKNEPAGLEDAKSTDSETVQKEAIAVKLSTTGKDSLSETDETPITKRRHSKRVVRNVQPTRAKPSSPDETMERPSATKNKMSLPVLEHKPSTIAENKRKIPLPDDDVRKVPLVDDL